MSSFPSFFIVFLCLSMHACIARHISLFKVGGSDKQKIENIDGAVMTTHHQETEHDSKVVIESSGQAPIKPHVSVSWRVPSKNGDKKPVFHSDYSMPRMRTPSHN